MEKTGILSCGLKSSKLFYLGPLKGSQLFYLRIFKAADKICIFAYGKNQPF
jgi:hypothetical protein